MKTADIALYHAKESIGSSYSYYSIEIENKFRRNNQLEENLKQALEKDEFDIYYQGIVDCNLERVTAAEALARWSNPELGDVEPSVFIPVAEKIGIMPELGLWIIERVFSDMKKWNCYGSLEEGVSINISIAQL
ncbi:EAL domain-containing protein, partial [Aduncisulcus paluster]